MASMPRTLTLFRRPTIDAPLARAYTTSAAVLRALDHLGLTTDNGGLVFKRVTLYDQRFVACEIETTTLTESLVKKLLRYRLVVMLTQTLGRPVMASARQDSVTFAIDLDAATPIGWRAQLRALLRKPPAKES
jgi:hypothetical protein